MTGRRAGPVVAVVAVAAVAAAALLAVAAPAYAQSPSTLPCAPPVTVCAPSPPGPEPTASPTPTPTAGPTPEPTPEPTPAPPPVSELPPLPPAPAPSISEPVGSPSSAAPSPTVAPSPSPSAAPGPIATRRVDLAGPFGLATGLLLALPLLLGLLAAQASPRKGPPMSRTAPWRLGLAAGCLALAALVGFVGWYRISDEPLLNFQVPLLASTGMAVVLLTVVGGALLVSEQLRADDRRIEELEEAVRTLAATLAPLVEHPPRRPEA